MLTRLYVIHDTIAKFYNKPFHLPNDESALRTASDLANDPTSECFKHPTDYSMWCIGTYDDQTATLDNFDKPALICRFHELQKPD